METPSNSLHGLGKKEVWSILLVLLASAKTNIVGTACLLCTIDSPGIADLETIRIARLDQETFGLLEVGNDAETLKAPFLGC